MDRAKSIEHGGKVLAAVRVYQEVNGAGKVRTDVLAVMTGLTEKQVEAAIARMSRGKHPQVDGDRYGVERINDIRHTF